MTNKHFTLFAIACLCMASFSFSNQCDNFYAKITYGLSHTKKALGATNFEHQMYYAERALIALEKSEAFMEECVCAKAVDKRLDAMEALNKAIAPVDWDAGRYFSKKSMGLINELITMLDECTLGTVPETVVEDSDDSTLEHEAYAPSEDDQESMEQEMIKVFKKHADDRLSSAEAAIAQLIQLSRSFANQTSEKDNSPENLEYHQKIYVNRAKKMLQEGLEALEQK
nr:hypothetical protein [Allomuricauda sp.]